MMSIHHFCFQYRQVNHTIHGKVARQVTKADLVTKIDGIVVLFL